MHNNLKIRQLHKTINITTDLLQACVRDDRKAIKVLFEHCFKMFMPVCCRYHNNEEDARASLNIGFMKILKNLEGTDQNLNFVAWSKRIMVNTLIDEYRKKRNYQLRVTGKETERELDLEADYVINDAESNLGFDNIIKLVNELPEVSAKVFNLYVIDGYNHKEIGDMLNMSEGTSKWHLSTARKILREKLEQLEIKTTRRLVI